MAIRNSTGITRRTALGSNACLLGSLLGQILWAEPGVAETEVVGKNESAELYVFRGPGETTVIATTWPCQFFRFGFGPVETPCVNIHTGGSTFKVALDPRRSGERYESGCRIYAGPVRSSGTPGSPELEAVVIEVPNELLAGAALEVWAERVDADGCRQRVGSPFLAKIIGQDRNLAALYHSTSPERDQEVLLPGVADRIATKARVAGQVTAPEAYGQRVASLLLPDVLRYDSRRPPGFTFATQNGRHPTDHSDMIVETILQGHSASPGAAAPHRQLQQTFPYLVPVSARRRFQSVV